jgi:uncharacterized membrane protein YgdD (TMEM256/DUF423 family)
MARLDANRGPGSNVLTAGAALGGLAVGTGALGAHLLRNQLTPEQLGIWGTAAQYQMYHALALLAVARLIARRSTALLRAAAWLFVAGIVFFSGSLYALAVTGDRVYAYFTPVGGAAFIAGWACLAAATLRPRD